MTSGGTGGGGSSRDPAGEDAAGTPPGRCGAADRETPNHRLSSATAVHLEHTPGNCIGNVGHEGSASEKRRPYSGYGSVRPSSVTSRRTVGSSTANTTKVYPITS